MASLNSPRPGLHVVVAEDSPTQAEVLREILVDAGYACTVARNGLEALDAARRVHPAVLITDVLMPDMDGWQLCRTIKADAVLRDVPVMILTSLRTVNDIALALESGADNFIRKPVEPGALLARIDFLLANRRLRAQSTLQVGVEIRLGGRMHLVTAQREQILDLLFASYEEALTANEELRQRQDEIQQLNLQLAARAAALEDANAQLRTFSHTVSHDLRAPLATIASLGILMEEQCAGSLDEKGCRYLKSIQDEARRTVRIVDDVLYMADIDRARVERKTVDLAALARETLGRLHHAQPGRAVAWQAAGQMHASCDERLLRIALENLLSNAWKFTSKQPQARIEVGVSQVVGERVYCVKDNGAGFDMRHAHRLFAPFERLHTHQEFEGFGVGLATVQRIVALHGGRIWADATPGQGASFYFTLGEGA